MNKSNIILRFGVFLIVIIITIMFIETLPLIFAQNNSNNGNGAKIEYLNKTGLSGLLNMSDVKTPSGNTNTYR